MSTESIKKKIVAIVFIAIIAGISSLIFIHAKAVGTAMLRGYPVYLPENDMPIDVPKAAIKSTTEKIDTIITGSIPFIEYNGAFDRIMGKHMIEDADPEKTVYKMDNGQLTFIQPAYDITGSADSVIELNNYLRDKNIDFLFVQAPFKIDKYDPQLPPCISDTVNANVDAFLQALSGRAVPFYDLREVIHDLKMPYADLFYNTDHHWKVETAFWAYTQVMRKINADYGYDINPDTIDPDQFIFKEFKSVSLGSEGRRVGRYYGGVDDYTVIMPKFYTAYTVKILYDSGNETELSGSFHDTIIQENRIGKKPSMDTESYRAYLGPNHPKIEITNNAVGQGRVLLVEDSFGKPFSAFVSLNFHETDILDLRYYTDQSLYEYLDANRYDMVMILYNPSSLSESMDVLYHFD